MLYIHLEAVKNLEKHQPCHQHGKALQIYPLQAQLGHCVPACRSQSDLLVGCSSPDKAVAVGFANRGNTCYLNWVAVKEFKLSYHNGYI